MLIAGERMNLRDYLYLKRMSVTEFSKLVDHSRNYISMIINGKHIPSKKLAKNIERITEGQVTIEELLKGKKGKKGNNQE
jgi:transcriptional regulator with XRE-family HTH domain